jgi:hypothetical protein
MTSYIAIVGDLSRSALVSENSQLASEAKLAMRPTVDCTLDWSGCGGVEPRASAVLTAPVPLTLRLRRRA